MQNLTNVLLRGSWQTKNIGDIAHTPGFLALAKRVMPEVKIWLWPCEIDRGVREMLLENYPGLRIVETPEEISEAFKTCELIINGSGPLVDHDAIDLWTEKTGKPYGFFGISADGYWDERRRRIYSGSSFIYCRDTLSLHFLRFQEFECPVIEFGPDASYFLDLAPGTAATDFLRENQLEDGKFICVIPRLRWTPNSFDDKGFYWRRERKEKVSLGHVDLDMKKLREVITHIVRTTDLKVLICPEMTYQVPLGRRYVYDLLPEDVKARTVLRNEYWITDEAMQVYAASHSLISMEMHSPIMYTVLEKPAIYLRQAEDTFKGQMWRDMGLQKWIFELNNTSAETITECVDSIINDYPAAVALAAEARRTAIAAGTKALAAVAGK